MPLNEGAWRQGPSASRNQPLTGGLWETRANRARLTRGPQALPYAAASRHAATHWRDLARTSRRRLDPHRAHATGHRRSRRIVSGGAPAALRPTHPVRPTPSHRSNRRTGCALDRLGASQGRRPLALRVRVHLRRVLGARKAPYETEESGLGEPAPHPGSSAATFECESQKGTEPASYVQGIPAVPPMRGRPGRRARARRSERRPAGRSRGSSRGATRWHSRVEEVRP